MYSLPQTFGQVVLEALASGLVSLSTRLTPFFVTGLMDLS